MRVHLRWEAFNLDALDIALADIAAGRVHLLAFNDHTPSILKRLDRSAKAAKYSDARRRLAGRFPRPCRTRRRLRESLVPAARDRIAAAARAAGMPMASHDDDTIASRDASANAARGSANSRWSEVVGRAAREAGDAVAMGSPNVVRGGSHLGWASAAALAEAGICTRADQRLLLSLPDARGRSCSPVAAC